MDHFQSDNLVTIDSYRVVKRKEDWNFLFARFVERSVKKANLDIKKNRLIATRLESSLYSTFHSPINKLFLFLSGEMGIRNFIFALEYTKNDGEKKFFPVSEVSALGVVFLTDQFFDNLYGSFRRIAILLHEAHHESMEFIHVPCLNSESMSCDNAPDGPYGLSALFLAYIAGVCGDDCNTMEKGFLMDIALGDFERINLYQSDDHKIHPLLENQLEDRQLALDIYDVMASMKQQRDEDFKAIEITLWVLEGKSIEPRYNAI